MWSEYFDTENLVPVLDLELDSPRSGLDGSVDEAALQLLQPGVGCSEDASRIEEISKSVGWFGSKISVGVEEL